MSPSASELGVVWLLIMIFVAIFADQLRPYGITTMDLSSRLVAPGHFKHWAGTDELGRDVFSRLLQSIKVSLIIAFGATMISAFLRHCARLCGSENFAASSNISCWSWPISRRPCRS